MLLQMLNYKQKKWENVAKNKYFFKFLFNFFAIYVTIYQTTLRSFLMIEFIGEKIDLDTEKLLKKIAKQTFKNNEQKFNKLEVVVEFVYDDEICELNKKHRGIDEVTDVLSFPNLHNVFGKKINKKNFAQDVNPENKKVYLYLDGKQVNFIGGEGIMITQPLSEKSLEM